METKTEIQITKFETNGGTCLTKCPFGMNSRVGASACTGRGGCQYFLHIDRINKEVICTGADRGYGIDLFVETELPF